MERKPPGPEAVLFDAYGTLFDVHSVARLAEQLFPGHGEALSQLWRDQHIDYTRLTSMSDRWRPFGELARAGLRFAALRLGLDLTPPREQALIGQYAKLMPFAENRAVLLELKQRGIRAGILSNGDPEMLEAVVAHAGFSDLLDPLLSVQPARRFKTDPACYALGTAALGLAADRVLFVSSNGWDAIGATWFGYTTLWVNRTAAPLEQLDAEPTRIGRDLRAVLDFF